MKALIILALSTALIGCSKTIATERNLKFPYTVESIKSYYNDKVCCLYYLKTGEHYITTKKNLVVRDSIGKFNIHDTIYVTLIKK